MSSTQEPKKTGGPAGPEKQVRSEPAARTAGETPGPAAGPGVRTTGKTRDATADPGVRTSGETGDATTDPAERPKSARAAEAEIPQGYGVDRVGAMAVDPERLFVYWELTDESIERSRKRVGSTAAEAPVVLRVYETTGRIFDGTNALGYFDHEIDRADRRWFFDINKPASEAVVELGLRLEGGGFVKIARSGRVEFPRAEAPPQSTPRWLTVQVREERPEPQTEPAPAPWAVPRHLPEPPRQAVVHPRPPEGHAEPAAVREPSNSTLDPPGTFHAVETEPHGVRTEPGSNWSVRSVPVELQTEERRVVHWERPASWSSWEDGPVATELDAPGPWTESWAGETRLFRDGPHTHVVTGPWEVVIRGLGAFHRREVLAHWELHRSWIQEEGHEVYGELSGNGRTLGSSEVFRRGASERRWLTGSELRLSGASERLYLGASERRLGGASERLLRGASERRLGGASERLLRGAGGRRLGGASERAPRGASERRLGGASERASRGASAFPRVEGEPGDG